MFGEMKRERDEARQQAATLRNAAQTLVDIYDADQGDERNIWTDGLDPLRAALAATQEQTDEKPLDPQAEIQAEAMGLRLTRPLPRKLDDLLPCECHGDELVQYCPRHTPLPGERAADQQREGEK